VGHGNDEAGSDVVPAATADDLGGSLGAGPGELGEVISTPSPKPGGEAPAQRGGGLHGHAS
jgi:hypothetical protein